MNLFLEKLYVVRPGAESVQYDITDSLEPITDDISHHDWRRKMHLSATLIKRIPHAKLDLDKPFTNWTVKYEIALSPLH